MAEELENKTIEELKQLIKDNYNLAIKNKTIERIGFIARQLGNNLDTKYGPKYELIVDDITVYVDDYGHWMSMKFKDKTLLSTHSCDPFIINDKKVIDTILSLYPKALGKYTTDQKEKEKIERQQLLSKIL